MKQNKEMQKLIRLFLGKYWRERTDREIAEKLGVERRRVVSVRQRMGLRKTGGGSVVALESNDYVRARRKIREGKPLSERERKAFDDKVKERLTKAVLG